MKTKTIETIGRIAAFLRGGAVAFLAGLAVSAVAVWAAFGGTAVAATGRSAASAGVVGGGVVYPKNCSCVFNTETRRN